MRYKPTYNQIMDDKKGIPEEIENFEQGALQTLFRNYNFKDLPKKTKSVHDGKRIGVQLLGDSGLRAQDVIAKENNILEIERAGWFVKHFNTFFDYWWERKRQ